MPKSKTDHIRDFLAKNPNASGKEAAEALKKYGISAQYFYTIKSNLSKPKGGAKAGKKKRGRKSASGGVKVQRAVRRTSTDLSFDDVQSVATFAANFGGLDKLLSLIHI